jgi:hypothetical protein
VVDRDRDRAPVLPEDRLEDLFLGGEVVVDEPVRGAGLVGDVGDAAAVIALARENARGGREQLLAARLAASGGGH